MADATEDRFPIATNQDIDLTDETQDFRFLTQIANLDSAGDVNTTYNDHEEEEDDDDDNENDNEDGETIPKTKSISQTQLPRRGEKDFEPNRTLAQAGVLQAARNAMHAALSYPRVHVPRNHVVGTFDPETARTVVLRPRGQVVSGGVGVTNWKGAKGATKGKGSGNSGNRLWLLPEETLFLVERGSLDVRWPLPLRLDVSEPGREMEGYEGRGGGRRPMGMVDLDSEGEVPMSLQGAYAVMMGMNGLTMERFAVYSGLKRLGYVVQRGPGWDDDDHHDHDHDNTNTNTNNNQKNNDQDGGGSSSTKSKSRSTRGHYPARVEGRLHETQMQTQVQTQTQSRNILTTPSPLSTIFGFIPRFLNWMFGSSPNSCSSFGPLVAPGLYRSYNDIYRLLAIIPHHNPSLPSPPSPSSSSSPDHTFKITFHVWRPSTPYRKSSPPPPDFQISVINARDASRTPTLAQLSALLDATPPAPPFPPSSLNPRAGSRNANARIKHGWRNVILAVVDQGVVSYLRVSEAGFGEEKIYEGRAERGQKGAGRGGRGRGGGGGRGARGWNRGGNRGGRGGRGGQKRGGGRGGGRR